MKSILVRWVIFFAALCIIATIIIGPTVYLRISEGMIKEYLIKVDVMHLKSIHDSRDMVIAKNSLDLDSLVTELKKVEPYQVNHPMIYKEIIIETDGYAIKNFTIYLAKEGDNNKAFICASPLASTTSIGNFSSSGLNEWARENGLFDKK